MGTVIKRNILSFFDYLGRIILFSKETIANIARKRSLGRIVREIYTIGNDSLLLVSLISFFIGIIIAFQTAYQLQKFSSQIYIASLVALSLTRELGPVLTALIIAAKSGAAITAEIGSMKVTEQLDALRSLATNPLDYIVAPKFIALIISLPLLVIYADALGIFGGYLVGLTKFHISFGQYFHITFNALATKDILIGLIKSFIFANIIAFISCFEGFQPFSSSSVAKAVKNSVVRSFITIIIFDCILTALFYYI